MKKKPKPKVSKPKPKAFKGVSKPTVYGPRVNSSKKSKPVTPKKQG